MGVALWHYDGRPPLAAFMKIPLEIRRLWSTAHSTALRSERVNDIYSIEAVGPAILMEMYPKLLANELWVHFIDNVGSQMCLVKGSASCQCPDEVIGFTWEEVARLRTLLYTDCVASADNPVDGLSRGKFEGPWRRVQQARLPRDLIRRIQHGRQDGWY